MGEHVIRLPDVGEGVAEAELVEWHVKVGDMVREDAVLAAVMTDKATVEIPSPVEGEILWLGAEIGETVAIGSPIVRLKVAGEGNVGQGDVAQSDGGERDAAVKPQAAPEPPAQPRVPAAAVQKPATPAVVESRKEAAVAPTRPSGVRGSTGAPRKEGEKPLASPAVRLRAREAGIDLRQVPGSGPAGRIGHDDLDAFIARGPQAGKVSGLARNDKVDEIKVVGLRRKIAEKMQLAKARIPHITYVEEVDVTALEELRAGLNKQKPAGGVGTERPKLTLLPFLMRAMVRAIAEQPQLNALYDDDAGIIRQYGGVHIGIRRRSTCGKAGRSSTVWPRRRNPAPPRARSFPAPPSPSPRSVPWAAW
jgi:2-oxoisovalerate dehydrogenase E2 component (dihydrolipoyl transacylase)